MPVAGNADWATLDEFTLGVRRHLQPIDTDLAVSAIPGSLLCCPEHSVFERRAIVAGEFAAGVNGKFHRRHVRRGRATVHCGSEAGRGDSSEVLHKDQPR